MCGQITGKPRCLGKYRAMVFEHAKENEKENLKPKRKLETNTWEAQKEKKGLRNFTIQKIQKRPSGRKEQCSQPPKEPQ